MKASLEKTITSLSFASDNLRDALNESNAVESIILLPLIKTVNETLTSVENLLQAKKTIDASNKL